MLNIKNLPTFHGFKSDEDLQKYLDKFKDAGKLLEILDHIAHAFDADSDFFIVKTTTGSFAVVITDGLSYIPASEEEWKSSLEKEKMEEVKFKKQVSLREPRTHIQHSPFDKSRELWRMENKYLYGEKNLSVSIAEVLC